MKRLLIAMAFVASVWLALDVAAAQAAPRLIVTLTKFSDAHMPAAADTTEPVLGEIEFLDKNVDGANRIRVSAYVLRST